MGPHEEIRLLLRAEGPVTQAILQAADNIVKSEAQDEVLRAEVSRVVDTISNQATNSQTRQTLEERVYYQVRLRWTPSRHRGLVWALHFVVHRLLSCTSVFILVLLALNAATSSLTSQAIWEN